MNNFFIKIVNTKFTM